MDFVDDQRDDYGVEPICKVLPIAPSTYYEQKARQADPDRLPPRIRRDRVMRDEIQRVWDENLKVYGARKVWLELIREGHTRGAQIGQFSDGYGEGVTHNEPKGFQISLIPAAISKARRHGVVLRPEVL